MNLKEKWSKQNNSVKLLLKKLKRHDTLVVGIAVVIATALCGGLIYLSTPVVTATAREELKQDEMANNEKTVEKLDELKEYLNGIDKTVAENQKNLSIYSEKTSENHKETGELTERMTNTVTEKVVGLDKDMQELRNLINKTEASIEVLKQSMEKNGSDNRSKVEKEITNLYVELEKIENKYSETQENTKNLMVEIQSAVKSGNKDLSKEMQDRYQDLLDRLAQTDSKLTEQSKTSLADFKTELSSISNSINNNFARIDSTINNGMNSMSNEITGVNNKIVGVNSEITNVKNGIAGVNNEVSNVKNDIAGVNNEVSNVNNGIAGVNNEITNVNSEIVGVKGDLTELKSYIGTEMGSVNKQLKEVFTYVSDGKKLVASALLTKGIKVREDATFAEIAAGIMEFESEYTLPGGEIPGEVEYTYHYHTDASGAECDDELVGEDRKGGCYTKEVHHVHDRDCYETEIVYYYDTNKDVVMVSYEGDYYTGEAFYKFHCNFCGKTYVSTGSGHVEKTTSLNQVKNRNGVLKKSEEKKTKICAYEDDELEGYATSCGYIHGQVTGAKLKFKGKGVDYETVTENGQGSETETKKSGLMTTSVSEDPDMEENIVDTIIPGDSQKSSDTGMSGEEKKNSSQGKSETLGNTTGPDKSEATDKSSGTDKTSGGKEPSTSDGAVDKASGNADTAKSNSEHLDIENIDGENTDTGNIAAKNTSASEEKSRDRALEGTTE
ncbi:MAG: hypothetical protein K6C96_09985 [Butyrivibrio sp.]|nr:hypothetical protein [Butyrivibrio sp.]